MSDDNSLHLVTRRRFKWVLTWAGAPVIFFEPSESRRELVWGLARPGLNGMHAHTFVDEHQYSVKTFLTEPKGEGTKHTSLRETGGGETASLEALTSRILLPYDPDSVGWVPKRSELAADTNRPAENPKEYVSYVPFELVGELLNVGAKPNWEKFEQVRIRDLLTRNDPFLLVRKGSGFALAMPINEKQMVCLTLDSLNAYVEAIGDFLGAEALVDLARKKLGGDIV
jgi:hypothetical protein